MPPSVIRPRSGATKRATRQSLTLLYSAVVACASLAAMPANASAFSKAALTPLMSSASAAPAASYSYYISASNLTYCAGSNMSKCVIWQMGAQASVPSGGQLVILDFGAPCQSAGHTGTQMFGEYSCTDDSQISWLITKWIGGFESTHGGGTPRTILAAGLSNSVNGVAGDPQTSSEMASIGSAWATRVVDAINVSGLAAPITMWGAIDAEESGGTSWLGPSPSIAFVDAYGSASGHGSGSFACNSYNRGMLADFGDAVYMEPGYDGYSGWNPPGGWTQAEIYHVAWGASVACAVPEIYYTVNAVEWASLSDWAVKNGHSAITFTGPMSENGVNSTLSGQGSWQALANATGQASPYLTNIAWRIQTSPAQLESLATSQSGTAFAVNWQLASGITGASYTLYSRDNSGPWLVWDNTVASTATFFGIAGHHYDFFIQTHGSGYSNGGPGSPEASTAIASAATPAIPSLHGLYALDGYGNLHPASSPPLATSATWPGWNIARGIAVNSSGYGGQVLDGYGGLHAFGNATSTHVSAYWNGWDIARGVVLNSTNGGYVLDGWGGLHPFGGAPGLKTSGYWPNWDIARGIVLRPDGLGGYVLDGWGGIHPFGNAPGLRASAYWPNWDIARGITLNASGNGGYVLDGFGGLHPFGNATPVASTAYWRGWDIARGITMVPGSATAGYVVDGWGGFHPFGGAPGITTYTYAPGNNVIHGADAA